MGLDLIFSIALTVFSLYCFVIIGANAGATATELGAAFWPRIILGLMIALLLVNIYQTLKKSKASGGAKESIGLGAFFKSKLFVGIILVAVMALVMDYIGFMATCFLFLIAYGILLGERRVHILLLTGLVATLILYILFQGPLAIMLPRGYGIFRDVALFCEDCLYVVFG